MQFNYVLHAMVKKMKFIKIVPLLWLFPFFGFSQTLIDYHDIDFTDIKFVNKNTGFVVGSWGTIFKTNDGGANWIDVSIGESKIMKIECINFIDSLNIIVAGGPGIVYKTTDGGLSWKKVYNQANISALKAGWFYSLTVVNPNLIFAFGRYGRAIISTDRGENWRPLRISPSNETAFGEITITTSPYLIASENGLHAISYFLENDSVHISALYESDNDIRSIQFFNNSNGWAVGQGCLILKKENDTFKNMGIPKETNYTYLNSLYFHNMQKGWVCGNYGVLLYTNDSGKNWTQVKGFPDVPLRKIMFVDDNTGFITGDGVVFKTTNSGKSWQLVLCEKSLDKKYKLIMSTL